MNEIATFDDWYRQSYGSVLSAVSAYCLGDHSTAEDVTNEAFVTALEDWSRVAEMAAPTAWVAKVAINSASRTFRRRKRRIELVNSQRLELFATDSQRDFDLWESLEKLSPRQRKALVLRYIEDLSQADVAQRMGVALGTATATLTHARGNLRSIVEQGENDVS